MSTTLEVFTLALIAAAAYSYIGYPVVLGLAAAARQLMSDVQFVASKAERRASGEIELPRVAIIISAYNEELHIAERVANLLDLDYPADKLRAYIGSDGSQDRTAAILSGLADPRLHAHIVVRNRGKATMLNELVGLGDEPILVFSDANTFFDRQALKRLVAPFCNRAVGGVTGELRLYGKGGDNQDGLYWRMEQVLKYLEGRIGGLLGANGAIYAIRRTFWKPLEPDTICDDFCVGMNVAAQGQRLVYEPSAWAHEEIPQALSDEYHRRVRIGIGNFQALFRHPEYLLNTSWGTRFAYLSHKVLRWVAPHLLLIALGSSAWLGLDSALWAGLALAQLGSYALGALLYGMSEAGVGMPSILKLPAYLFALNWAFLVASVRYLTGQYSGSWRRTTR